jgi:predicted 3-demethylubiquinone-9 3-methyltransferase (glyoxalase superfamily)
MPAAVSKMLTDPDAGRSNRAFAALMQMKKLDLAKLEAAYNG